MDNGSIDESCEVVAAEFPDVLLSRNHENLGFCIANNQGAAAAFERKNEYVLILNNDTVLHPDCIGRLVARAQAGWTIATHRFVEVAIGITVGLLFTALWPEHTK